MGTSETEQLIRAVEETALRNGADPRAFRMKLTGLSTDAAEPVRAMRNLARLLESGFSSSLISDFASFPVLLEVFFELVGQSQYLADILVRDPELLRWLTATGELKRHRIPDELAAEARSSMSVFERPERQLDAVRRFHRREMLRLGAREILREADVVTITAELSALADAVTSAVTSASHADLNRRLGIALPNKMSILALGKLGGQELNFSSDIDLMFVYDEDGDLPTDAGRLHTYHEYYVRLAEAVVRGLSEFTGEGHLYRVDMRLRPDGRSGPLAMSRAAMMVYYESRGAAWERQMLLKVRPIAGAIDVGEQFLLDLRPFIFPRSALRSPWEEIAGMKRAIEQEGVAEGNIKLGAGGIRDVEFLVQGLQLLYAGNDPALRTGNTLRALALLPETGVLASSVADRLRIAYEFFRTVEHRLQLLHGRQTHQLPETVEENRVLARKLGFPTANAFREHLGQLREFVRAQFVSFTAPRVPADSVVVVTTTPISIATVLADRRWPAEVHQVVRQRLESGFSSEASRRLLDLAFRNVRHREWLIRTALAGTQIMERLAAEPLFLESLLYNAVELLGRSAPGWHSLKGTDLCRYRLFNETRTAVRFLAGSATVAAVEHELSALSEEVVETVAGRLESQPRGIALLAMGKLGGREMGFGSDVDLVAVFDERTRSRHSAEKVAQELAKGLSLDALLYKVDFRLRPEGKNSPLAVEVAYLRSYLKERAEPWERMALTRCRIVWGDRTLGSQILRTVRSLIHGPIPRAAAYVLAMRNSMERQRVRGKDVDLKISAGGIADVEFIAQALALRRPGLMGKSTDAVLRSCVNKRWIAKGVGTDLRTGLAALRQLEMLVRLNSPTAASTWPSDVLTRACLAVHRGYMREGDHHRELAATMRATRKAFRAALRSIDSETKGSS